MNIVVLIKEVPDMEKVRFDSERGVVDRSSADAEMNPFDLYALQAAADLKNIFGAHVTALTMGPPGAVRTLRDAWARGADECVLLTDRAFAGSDTYATAGALAAALKTMEFDLIITGEKSVDGDTAQVGAEVAEFLDLPHSYYVDKIINFEKALITVSVPEICGLSQTREMRLPALISVSKNISAPLLPTLDRKLESLNIEVSQKGIAALAEYLCPEETGLKGSPTKIAKIEVPKPETRESVVYRDNHSEFLKAASQCLKTVSG